VRHVLPERANYLTAPTATAAPESAVVAEFEQVMDSSALIQRVLAVLDEGRRSATYKPALLLALVELAVERVQGLAPLELPLDDIAERVMELYWPQTRPYTAAEGALRQATTPSSRIVDALIGLRRAAAAAVNQSLGRVRIGHPVAYLTARDKIARALELQPIPRLQRPRGGRAAGEHPRFLYDDHDFAPEKGWLRRREPPVVRLLPGVADALARAAPLLRIATQEVWVREVAAINKMQTQEQELRSFLFGADRVGLQQVADGMRDLGIADCFWCERRLGAAVEVDHVIPWSHFPNDDLFNLVLADRECNNSKRDRLVTAELVERWTQRELSALKGLAGELQWPFAPRRSGLVAASAYRYLPEGMPVWAGRDQVQIFSEHDRTLVEESIDALLA
jgi:5-methylcytosine-specific restriction endonuclease McrA